MGPWHLRWTDHPEGQLEDYVTDGVTIDEAIRRHGNLRIQRAAINSARREYFGGPRLRGYPPRVFVSYRWEDEESRAWMNRLVAALRSLGNEVHYDQEHQDGIQPDGTRISEFVGAISASHVFLTVVTPALVEAAIRRHWLFEENQIAVTESQIGRLRMAYVWKDGDRMPDFAGGAGPIDMRGRLEEFSLLAPELKYDGLVFSAEEQRELLDLLFRTEALLEAERYDEALQLLQTEERFEQADEYRQLVAYALAGIGAGDEAFAVACDVLENGRPSHETMTGLALLLGELGEARASLIVFLRAHRMAPRLADLGQMSIADALADLGSLQGAVNHARQWIAISDPSESERALAAEIEERARERAGPGRTGDDANVGCRGCPARYAMEEEDRLCGRCASVYPPAAACPYCGHTGIVNLALIRDVGVICPTCFTPLVKNPLEVLAGS